MASADRLLKLLGVLWSIVFFIGTASFFLFGNWTAWTHVKQMYESGELQGAVTASRMLAESHLVTEEKLSDVLGKLGNGKEVGGGKYTVKSAKCDEGYAMVGVSYDYAREGKNAGVVYSGVDPVCRKIVR